MRNRSRSSLRQYSLQTDRSFWLRSVWQKNDQICDLYASQIRLNLVAERLHTKKSNSKNKFPQSRDNKVHIPVSARQGGTELTSMKPEVFGARRATVTALPLPTGSSPKNITHGWVSFFSQARLGLSDLDVTVVVRDISIGW